MMDVSPRPDAVRSAMALPDLELARPTGVGHATTAYRMPIGGRMSDRRGEQAIRMRDG